MNHAVALLHDYEAAHAAVRRAMIICEIGRAVLVHESAAGALPCSR